MTERKTKLERALGAVHDDLWTELQHRRVAKRVHEAVAAPAQGRRRSVWGLSAAAAAAACVAAWFMLRPPSEPGHALSGTALGSDVRALSATFADGSLVEVDRGGRLRIIGDRREETRVELLSGRAEFEVQKRPGRPFVTTIRGVEVRVVGTHFSTELDLRSPPGLVRVTVQRGTVDVRAPASDRVARLNTGDALEISLGTGKNASAPAANAVPSAASTTPSAAGAPVSSPAPRDSVPGSPPDASKLFEAAHEARRSGNVQAAARAYTALIKQFPSDERVGVAALELGRLRMDALHAYGPAAEAFRRAILAAPNEGIREDALARLIEALDAMGDRTACLREQGRYQARYPRGVHATAVGGRCASRK